MLAQKNRKNRRVKGQLGQENQTPSYFCEKKTRVRTKIPFLPNPSSLHWHHQR